MTPRTPRRLSLTAAALTTTALVAGGLSALAPGAVAVPTAAATTATAPATKTTALHGTLELAPGAFVAKKGAVAAHYTGSYFRMILPGGTDEYFTNPNSKAPDKTYTLFVPGTDGGLKLGQYQQPPSPAFDANGNAKANRIVRPDEFAGIYFSISTAKTDAQDSSPDVAPSLTLHGTKTLTGNFQAWTAGWNTTYFNQGSPKPDGTFPGFTRPVTGTYNPATHAFTIVWYSLIVGGPFNGFTGYWHLQGVLANGTFGLTPATPRASVKPGKTATLRLTAANWTVKALARTVITAAAPKNLRLAPKSKRVSVAVLKPGKSAAVALKLTLGPKAKPGRYKVKLTWATGRGKLVRTAVVTVTKTVAKKK